jgi:competence protein ComFC
LPETTSKEQILDLFFPASCLNCGTCGSLLCRRCLAELAGRAAAQYEDRSWQKYPSPAFNDFRAAGDYGGLLKEMVLRLKSSQRPLAAPLSRLMLAAAGNEPAYLAPERVFFVPSEKRKIKQRGFNPAELLAVLIARHLGRPLGRSLYKVKRTLDQDGLSGRQRWVNVEGAFTVAAGSRVHGQVLLVDDVLTTGATSDCCARALIDAGADRVNVLVAARARFNIDGAVMTGFNQIGKIVLKSP